MTASFDLTNDPLVRAAVEALLNSLWQGTALTALTWAFLRAARRANAATRYGVWFATLLALVALPVTNALLSRADSKTPAAEVVRQTLDAPAVSSSAEASDRPAAAPSASMPSRGGFAEEPAAASGGQLRLSVRQKVELPSGEWLLVVFFGWLLAGGVRAARVVASHGRLRRLKRNSAPLGARHQARLRQFLAAYPRARATRLASSTDINMPMAVGLTNPVVLFPQTLVEQLTEDEFDQILLHELAHVQRRDDWTNFAQKLAEAILFFHPAVLWIGRRLNLEREVACDDHVISATNEGRRYAVCLTRLAELTVMPRRSGLAPGALLSRKHIFSRVEFLLRKRRDTNPRLSKIGLLLPLGTLLAVLLPCLLVSPVISLAAGEGARGASAFAWADAGPKAAEGARAFAASAETSRGEADGRRKDFDAAGTTSDAEVSRPAHASVESRTAATTSDGPRTTTASAAQANDESALLIDSITRMSSSSDKTAALLAFVEGRSRVDALPAGFFEAVAKVPSSLDRTRVLSALLEKRPGKGLLVKTLKAAEGIVSDSDKTELLIKASRVCPNDDAVLAVYLGVVATLHSSSDQERALSALLRRSELSRAILVRARSLALSRISNPESQQIVLDRIRGRLGE
ncbi:MAG TPA: M56 family metallopeptidase [Pyrinomonadaceae bacterium]|nr:M56 family metallopeptidase [Pyrinomonadaceae bacterium]